MVIRPNWRDLPVVDLTDEEVEQMSPQDTVWCAKLLIERLRRRGDLVPEERGL